MGVALKVRTSTSRGTVSASPYAEPQIAFFVYDDQSEVLELNVLLEEPVSADTDVNGAAGYSFCHRLLLILRTEAAGAFPL